MESRKLGRDALQISTLDDLIGWQTLWLMGGPWGFISFFLIGKVFKDGVYNCIVVFSTWDTCERESRKIEH